MTTGSAGLGVIGGIAAGAAFNLLFGFVVVRRHANPLASGLALWFLGGGLSTLLGARFVGRDVHGLGRVGLPLLSGLRSPYDRIFEQDALVWLMPFAAFGAWFLLRRTRWGLHVRATGEDRTAAFAAGLRPDRLQLQVLALAGGASGLAGAQLALAFTQTWQDGMTAGRGFLAIVIVILSLWDPVRALVGATAFSATVAIGLQLQAQGAGVSPFVLDMLPYAVALAVVLIAGRAKAFVVPGGLREVFQGTAK